MEKYLDYIKESFELEFIINEDNSQILHEATNTIIVEKNANKIVFYLYGYNLNDQQFVEISLKLTI